MFIPVRKDGQLFKLSETNAFGEAEHSTTGTPFGWAPVHMRDVLQASSVRADASASKARAESKAFDARIIVEKTLRPYLGDKIVLGRNDEYEVTRVQERSAINGVLHHFEVDLREV